MRRNTWIMATWLPLLALTVSGCEKSDGSESRPRRAAKSAPNIILLTVESLRADHIGSYGYNRDTSPTLDALAAEGIRYENAFSVTSWTLTSHATIFTGLYPTTHQVIGPTDRLSDDYETIAERLWNFGYQTAAIVSGVYLDPKHNLNQGFEYYDAGPIREPGTPEDQDITNPKMEAAMIHFLRQVRDPNRPFFLFGYYWDPHHRYIPPPPYDTMFVPPTAKKPRRPIMFHPAYKLGKNISRQELEYVVAQYDGEVRCTDACVGRMFNLLKDLGLWENTAILVTADHGEEFYDHGKNSHKNSLYAESIHVPLIYKPAGASTPRVDPRPVDLVDLFATLCNVAGCDVPDAQSGVSLLTEPPPENRALFFELKSLWWFSRKSTGESWKVEDDWRAVLKGAYKLINVENQNRWELYNVISDPTEQNPLTAGFEEVTGELQGELERWRQTAATMAKLWTAGGEAPLTPEEMQRLRSLGYVP